MREGIGLLQKCMQCFILIEQTICERMKISITEFSDVLSFLPQCLAKAEVVRGGTISKLSMGIEANLRLPLEEYRCLRFLVQN